jgi:hypothetical protein
MNNPVVLVTAFIDLNEDRSNCKSVDLYWSLFNHVVSMDLPIILFTNKKYEDRVKLLPSNVHARYIELEDTETYKLVNSFENVSIPSSDSPTKDTKNFMILMNAKVEFVGIVARENEYNHVAWCDFGIAHVLHDTCNTMQTLKNSLLSLPSEKSFLLIPGCWSIGVNAYTLTHTVNWRYLGGFFIADSKSIINLHDKFFLLFPKWLENTRTLVWEVNIWAWLELVTAVKFDWYHADHNDSMLMLPSL